jgi:hypothetical protein
MKSTRSKARTGFPAARATPDIPADILLSTATSELSDGTEVVVRDCILENLSLSDSSPNSVVFESSILKRISFSPGAGRRDSGRKARGWWIVIRQFRSNRAESTANGIRKLPAYRSSRHRSRMPGHYDRCGRCGIFSISIWKL